MGRAKYGNQTHFVKWDDEAEGGRWFECTIGETGSDGRYSVLGHGGWEAHFKDVDLVAIGKRPSVGDTVLAYWQGYGTSDKNFAYKSTVTAVEVTVSLRHFSVVYQDGSEEWVPEYDVHKLQTM